MSNDDLNHGSSVGYNDCMLSISNFVVSITLWIPTRNPVILGQVSGKVSRVLVVFQKFVAGSRGTRFPHFFNRRIMIFSRLGRKIYNKLSLIINNFRRVDYFHSRFVEDILESTLSLLSLGNNHFGLSSYTAIISPLHYMALLDPKASWFKKWMVSAVKQS